MSAGGLACPPGRNPTLLQTDDVHRIIDNELTRQVVYRLTGVGVAVVIVCGGAFGLRMGPDGIGTGVGVPCNLASRNFFRCCASALRGSRWRVLCTSAIAALKS